MNGKAVSVLVACLWALLSAPARADWVKLPDGRVIDCRIVRKIDGALWFVRAGAEKEELLVAPAFLDAGFGALPGTYRLPTEGAAPGAARGVVITLGSRESDQGDFVGVDITAANLERLMPCLEEDLGECGERIVLLRVCSGGGVWSEVEPIVKVLEEYKKRWRVVCWNDKAIGTAAMAVHCVPEHIFAPAGIYGAATGWMSCMARTQPFSLADTLRSMERISFLGGHDHRLMRSMQIQQPLSCTRGDDGLVRWFADETTGTLLVNREAEILCLNSATAEQCGFSKGTTDSVDDVGRLLCKEGVEWVGEIVDGVAWPGCMAEQKNVEFRRGARVAEEAMQIAFRDYQRAAANAYGTARIDRGPFVEHARSCLSKMRDFAREHEPMALLELGCRSAAEVNVWFAREGKRLLELMR